MFLAHFGQFSGIKADHSDEEFWPDDPQNDVKFWHFAKQEMGNDDVGGKLSEELEEFFDEMARVNDPAKMEQTFRNQCAKVITIFSQNYK